MACCQKVRKKTTSRLLNENLDFFRDSLKKLNNLKNAKPSSLSDKLLLDYHRKTHMLYEGNIKRRPMNRSFVNAVVILHDNFVKEMIKRKMKHSSPLKKV